MDAPPQATVPSTKSSQIRQPMTPPGGTPSFAPHGFGTLDRCSEQSCRARGRPLTSRASPSAFVKDWGFSALVEYASKHILFDTGNNAAVFAANAKAAKFDLGKLDFAVISHRHLDHTAGLEYLLKVNPGPAPGWLALV